MFDIYQLSAEVQSLERQLIDSIDEDTGEIDTAIMQALSGKREEFNDKAISVAKLTRKFERRKAEIDDEIKRLKALSEKAEKVIERLEHNLTYTCGLLGIPKIEGIGANIAFRKSIQTKIDNEELIPDDFKKISIKETVDKNKVKQAIQRGENVNGAHLEEITNIQIT